MGYRRPRLEFLYVPTEERPLIHGITATTDKDCDLKIGCT